MKDTSLSGQLLQAKMLAAPILKEKKTGAETFELALNICMSSGFPVAICWGDQFTFFYNADYSAILGNKHPSAMGASLKQVFPEIWENLEGNLLRVLKESKTLKFSDTPFLLNRHGYLEECYFDYTISPIASKNGEVLGVFNVVLETTLKVIAERRKKILNQLLALQNYAQHFNLCVDACCKILNEATQEIPFSLLYVKDKQQEYKLVCNCGLQEPLDEVDWPAEPVIQSGKVVYIASVNEILIQPVTTFYPEPCCETLIVPIKQCSSGVSGYLVAGISPRKKLDTEYQNFIENVAIQIGMCFNTAATFEEFLLLEQEKDNLLSIISHELKTPITSIKAYSQLAVKQLEQQGQTDAAKFIHKMNRQISRLQLIVSDMVDGTNFHAGKLTFYNTDFDFNFLISDIANTFEQQGHQHQIIINSSVDRPFHADKTRIEQILFNLLSNAVKYSPTAGKIDISCNYSNEQLTFSIRDYGIGIGAEEQPKIFDRFYRSLSIEQYTFPGMGLGLFIVKEIVQRMGGKIWINSVEGEGTTFFVSLPVQSN